MAANLRMEIGADGVAVLAIDVADRSMNVYTPELTAELREAVRQVATRTDIAGAVVTSGKASGFLAGADLTDLVTAQERRLAPREAAALVADAADVLRELETCGKPFAAAINGIALGGGYELALACHHRVIADDSRASVGLPEVTVGLLPAGGGTQRLPRLIGIPAALDLLLSGRRVGAREALERGLVDAVLPADRLVDEARRWVLAHPGFQQPWDRKCFTVPGGAGALAPHAMESFSAGMARIRRTTQDNFPAPAAILACVYEGTQLPMDRALAIERQRFGQLLAGPVAGNMIRTLFLGRQAARKLTRRPKDVPPTRVARLGVLGAGMMGAGIANVAAAGGIDVVLVDTSEEAAQAGLARVSSSLTRDVKAGRCDRAEADRRLARIHATSSYEALRGCDMAVEAVFEDRAVKARSYARVGQTLGELPSGFVMASNTSTLPITGLAREWERPEEFVGIHFFSPVERMELVEVIVGQRTSAHALARALDLVAHVGKVPIVVNDSPGFYTSRIFCAYIDEGMAMLAEGVAPALIENAARQAGFATGPLAVTDEVSLDLQERVIGQAVADGLPAKFLRQHAQPVVDAMVSRGRLGRKTAAGFYDFPTGKPKRLWPGLADLFPVAADQPDVQEVKRRLLYMQALESARCVEENVVPQPTDGDLGSVLALGYPAWTGGTLSFIDMVGADAFIAECDRLADRNGERFRPSAWLREHAATHKRFHSRTR